MQMRASFVEDLEIASAGVGDSNHSARLYPQFCCFRCTLLVRRLVAHLPQQTIFSHSALLQLVADVSAWRGDYAGLWAHTVIKSQ